MSSIIHVPTPKQLVGYMQKAGYLADVDEDNDPFVLTEHNRRVFAVINKEIRLITFNALFFGDSRYEAEKDALQDKLREDQSIPEVTVIGGNMGLYHCMSFSDKFRLSEFYKSLFYICRCYNRLLSRDDVALYYPYATRQTDTLTSANSIN